MPRRVTPSVTMPVMPPQPMKIRPASIAVAEQVNYLGTRRQAELDTFLPALQANPYDPKIIEKCELLPNERYRYVLPSGCAVTWQIESRPEEGTPHSTGDDRVILLLDIEY